MPLIEVLRSLINVERNSGGDQPVSTSYEVDLGRINQRDQAHTLLESLSFAELLQLSKEGLLSHYTDPVATESVQFGLVKKHHFRLLINDTLVLEIVRERETMCALVERIKIELLGTRSGYDPIVYYHAQAKIEEEKRRIDLEKLKIVRKNLRDFKV